MRLWLMSVVLCAAVSPCCFAQEKKRVYFNGDIITVAGDQPELAEALVIQSGKIAFVGRRNEALGMAGPDAENVDLGGRTLTPGFIDAHGHLLMAAHTLLDANLTGVKDIPELLARLREHAKEVPEGDRIVGMGYRAEQMVEKRHPTREELDSVSTTRPIAISDGSGHHGVINSGIMKELGITAATPDPEGGVFFRKPGSRELDGHIAEAATMQVVASRPSLKAEQIRKGIGLAVALWKSQGQTTACEMGLGLSGDDIDIVLTMIEEQLLPIDLVMFAKESASKAIFDAGYQVARRFAAGESDSQKLLAARPGLDVRYIHRVRLGGIKIWMDGSIDTCFMSQPFRVNPPGVTTSGYRGMRVDPQETVLATVEKYWKSEKQIAAHAIGDEANEQFLQACEAAMKKWGPADHRPIFQHAQVLRPDQIARIKKVGGTPSLTAAGIYPMGDYMAELLGPEREPWIGAANSFVRQQMPWTIHHDMPAGVSPSLIYAMWNVVNRQTRSGRVLGPEERVKPYEALRSITIHGAYQFKEEKTKGSLEVGKLADLVILDRNPLKIPPAEIKEIRLLATIKEGQIVYQADQ